MKRFIALVFLALCFAQGILWADENPAVTKALRAKYAMAQYHPEYGGWYLIRYASGNQTLYGFCDSKGNVVAQNATEYKLHKGYIELYILDVNQKQQHDLWEQKMIQYRKDYAKYDRVRGDYENELANYRARLKEAEAEAKRLHQQARDAAYNDYIRRAQAQMQQNSYNAAAAGGGWAGLGAALGNLIGTAVTAGTMKKNAEAAANAVKYDPIYKSVISQRGLSYAPAEPYNPCPTKPVEPSNGFSWETYPLLQPCPYSYIEYSAIQEVGGYADVKKDGEYGLVDASLKLIYPCNSSVSLKKGKVFDMQRVLVNDHYGLLNKRSEEVLKPIYEDIVADGEIIMAKKDGLWAIYTQQGKPLTQHLYSSYQAKGDNFLCDQKGKIALVTRKGQSVLPANLDRIADVAGDLYCYQNNKVGLYSVTGTMIFPIEYNSMELIDNYFKVNKDSGYGLYTKKAKCVYPCSFQDLKLGTINQRKVVYLENNNRWGVQDVQTQDTILPIAFSDVAVRKFGGISYWLTNLNGKYGLYNAEGLFLIPCSYDQITETKLFDRTMFLAKKGNTISLFGPMGLPIIPYQRYNDYEWKEPFFYVKLNNKQGVVTSRGQEIVPCEYDNLSFIKSDSCFVGVVDGKSTIVSMQGTRLFDPIPYRIIKTTPFYIVILDAHTGRLGLCSYAGRAFVQPKCKDFKAVSQTFDKYIKKNGVPGENLAKTKLLKQDCALMQQNDIAAAKKRMSFSYLAKTQVEEYINSWQQQSEFEKTSDWKKRVNEQTRAQQVFRRTKDAEKLYINREKHQIKFNLQLKQYDPDNETYLVMDSTFGKMLVSVPINEAEYFRTNWNSLKTTPTFFVDNDQINVSKMVFTAPNGKAYEYANDRALNYAVADVDYDFNDFNKDKRTALQDGLTSIEVPSLFVMQEVSSVLTSYNNDFASFNMPDKDDSFPFALFRVKLEGDTKAVKMAKQELRLYLGQMFVTQAMVTSYSNEILFLIPVGVRNVMLDGGDGHERQTLFSGPLRSNKIYDGIVKVQ